MTNKVLVVNCKYKNTLECRKNFKYTFKRAVIFKDKRRQNKLLDFFAQRTFDLISGMAERSTHPDIFYAGAAMGISNTLNLSRHQHKDNPNDNPDTNTKQGS
jgi:hypothetical protein